VNSVIINLQALRRNFEVIVGMMRDQGASWSVVTKALCGHEETIKALHMLGARSVADSRLDNLRTIKQSVPTLEKWYLRLPHLSVVEDVVALSDVSLNSEIEIIRALGKEAARQGKTHSIVIMIELGDLREGILPGTLVKFYKGIFDLPNIQVLGIGAQIGCLAGAVPSVDQVAQLLLYRELLELKFNHKLPLISAGSSIFLPLLQEASLPRGMNHYRIGEALFLGTDLVHGGTLKGLRDDVILLEAEIAEIKQKSLVTLGETVHSQPFEPTVSDGDESQPMMPGQRGYRALVTVGQIDTDVAGLTPVNPAHQIAGASSDITVVNLGDDPGGLGIGDTITFKPNYSAFVRLMNDSYIAKKITPSLDEFATMLPDAMRISVPPAMDDVRRNGDGGPGAGNRTAGDV